MRYAILLSLILIIFSNTSAIGDSYTTKEVSDLLGMPESLVEKIKRTKKGNVLSVVGTIRMPDKILNYEVITFSRGGILELTAMAEDTIVITTKKLVIQAPGSKNVIRRDSTLNSDGGPGKWGPDGKDYDRHGIEGNGENGGDAEPGGNGENGKTITLPVIYLIVEDQIVFNEPLIPNFTLSFRGVRGGNGGVGGRGGEGGDGERGKKSASGWGCPRPVGRGGNGGHGGRGGKGGDAGHGGNGAIVYLSAKPTVLEKMDQYFTIDVRGNIPGDPGNGGVSGRGGKGGKPGRPVGFCDSKPHFKGHDRYFERPVSLGVGASSNSYGDIGAVNRVPLIKAIDF